MCAVLSGKGNWRQKSPRVAGKWSEWKTRERKIKVVTWSRTDIFWYFLCKVSIVNVWQFVKLVTVLKGEGRNVTSFLLSWICAHLLIFIASCDSVLNQNGLKLSSEKCWPEKQCRPEVIFTTCISFRICEPCHEGGCRAIAAVSDITFHSPHFLVLPPLPTR